MPEPSYRNFQNNFQQMQKGSSIQCEYKFNCRNINLAVRTTNHDLESIEVNLFMVDRKTPCIIPTINDNGKIRTKELQ